MAVNPGVPMMYPKVRAKIGPRALYVDSPARHIMVEFAFDVVQVARGGYVAQDYRDRIGFEVSKPLLARAFQETYGLELEDLFMNEDLAISTYRNAVGTTIPDLTRIAWISIPGGRPSAVRTASPTRPTPTGCTCWRRKISREACRPDRCGEFAKTSPGSGADPR